MSAADEIRNLIQVDFPIKESMDYLIDNAEAIAELIEAADYHAKYSFWPDHRITDSLAKLDTGNGEG